MADRSVGVKINPWEYQAERGDLWVPLDTGNSPLRVSDVRESNMQTREPRNYLMERFIPIGWSRFLVVCEEDALLAETLQSKGLILTYRGMPDPIRTPKEELDRFFETAEQYRAERSY